MRSASASGPIGCANPSFAIVSIASASATPSMSAYAASFTKGMRMRFETNPGKSFACAGVFPSSSASATIAAAVSSEVCTARITSTSASTGTGLKKCMPMTFSGRAVTAASEVIGIDDVFEARIASGGSTLVRAPEDRLLHRGVLDDRLDEEVRRDDLVDEETRPSTSAGSAPPFSASLRKALLHRLDRPLPAPGTSSCSETRRPDAATTCAMPPPIWPAPTTTTCSNRTAGV